MREILFRGKRINDDEWVKGYYIIIPFYMNVRHYIRPFICENMPDGEDSYLIDPETVGQFTGLLDKNGKKIFEGDIIKCSILYDVGCYPHSKTEVRAVIYREGCFNPLYDCERNTYEIIGNIHDNPELLEK